MKNCVIIFVSFLFATNIFAQIHDPNAAIREAKNYHGIVVSNAFNVFLSQGNEEAVAVSASNDKDQAMITAEVKNGILYIGYSKEWKWKDGNKNLKAYISFKTIDRLKISGASDVFIVGTINSAELSIELSGASDLKGNLEVNKLAIDLSGASDMRITGKAIQLYVEARGASTFKGYDLATDMCDARASGASDIKITVNKELSAHASGASDVKYRGEGVIRDIKSSGSSSVSKGQP